MDWLNKERPYQVCAVEGSAVRHSALPNSPWVTRDLVAQPNLDKTDFQPSLRD